MIKLDLEALPLELAEAAREVLPLLDMEDGEHGIPVVTEENAEGLEMYFSNDGSLVIGYKNLCEFFRALGKVKKLVEDGIPVKETAHFEWLSYMADVSRNGVMNLPTAKLLIRYLALMGYNDLMLYTEDTYELPHAPYWGHQRGKYTLEELKELIAYGERFGITLSPCVQTLGHLKMPLLWDAFHDIKDSPDVLYVGKEETYEFLDKMFATLCSVYKTRRFNIGMDEAHSLGTGRRLRKEGYTPKSELMTLHLKRVKELCEKHGIRPMIWSDMFFRPHTKDNGYYSTDVKVPDEVIEGVPENFTLVYWDYYNCHKDEKSQAMFDHMIEEHKRFRAPLAFAGGAWKWTGYAPNNAFSLYSGDYHLNACLNNGIRDITLTAWGDDGAEASVFSVLPALLLYAEKLYLGTTEKVDISRAFSDIFGVELETFLLLDLPNRVPDGPEIPQSQSKNPNKYLLYNDCLCGRLDRHVDPSYGEFYAQTAKTLAQYADLPRFGYLFDTLACLCEVLKTKATLSVDLREAYRKKDRKQLQQIADRIDPMIGALDHFQEVLREQWYKENKIFGFEALEMRLGAIRQRAVGAKATVEMYLQGKRKAIEPLEEPVLYYDCRPEDFEKTQVLSIAIYSQCTPVTFLQD